MRNQTQPVDVEQTEPADIELDRFASYEDGEEVVICDRKSPAAWIKSATTTKVER